MTSHRERLGWALLFSLPVGVGVGLATAKVAATTVTDPLVLGTVAGFAAAMFALVYGAASVNQG